MTRKIECDACGKLWTDTPATDRPMCLILTGELKKSHSRDDDMPQDRHIIFNDLCIKCVNRVKNNIKDWMKPGGM